MMQDNSKIRINHKGFTMIEVVVVLILLAILAPVIASRFTTSSVELAAQADVIKAHIRFAQIRAMNDTVSWGIRFTSSTTYTLFKTGATTPPSNLPGAGSHVHTLTNNVSFQTGVGSSITFDEWGRPIDASGTPLTANFTITLNPPAGSASTITVTKNTGHVP